MNEPYDKPLLGIDLGASFTKLSYRLPWSDGTQYRSSSRIVMIDGLALIPSLVIQTTNPKKPWMHGKKAADYRPAAGDKVFKNWKSHLFSETPSPEMATWRQAAQEFFKWLRRKVAAQGIKVSDCRVKVCLPAFHDIERHAAVLGEEMVAAGWRNATVSRVTEPRANTVGVFAEGRNALYRQARGNEIEPVFMRMYPLASPLLGHLRNCVLRGGPRFATCAIIDVGSFTTDVSFVEFDAQADGDYIGGVSQESHRTGVISGFEQPLFRELENRHGFEAGELSEVGGLSFDEREDIKQRIGDGQTGFTLTLPDNRNVTLGDVTDCGSARLLAKKFAKEVRSAYRKCAGTRPVRYLVLTGGGSEAPMLRSSIKEAFSRDDLHWVDADGMEEPRGDPLRWPRWPNTGERLVRLATAVGATSVILDLPTGDPPRKLPDIRKIVSPWISCSCQGGNKDCMRCWGRGVYRRTRV